MTPSPRSSSVLYRNLLPAALAGVLLVSCGESARAKNPSEKPRTVHLVKAATADLPHTVTAVGTLAAEDRADLSFKVPGRLVKFDVDIGSRVAEGTPLAELERSDYQLVKERSLAALRQARARLGLAAEGPSDDVESESTPLVRQMKARMEQARAELARNRSLRDEGLLSHSAYDVVEANFKVAESQYNDALEEVNNRRGILAEKRSDLAIAEQRLADATLRAPFAGSVQVRKANLGEYLAAGTAVLTLVKMNPVRLRVDVPEREARAIRKGQSVAVHLEGDPTIFSGVVARVSPAFEEANRSLIVEAEIPNPLGRLRPGSFARAEIQTDSAPVLAVPSSAVVVFAGIEKVLTVKDGKAVERPVVTGRREGLLVEILSGVKDGDLVVQKPGNLATGMDVIAENAPSAPSGPGARATAAP